MADKVKEAILNAGAEAFAQYGYDKTTVEDIARLAHKAKTSVYYYFNGKADIFRNVLTAEFGKLMDELEPVRKLPENYNPVNLRNYLKKRMELITSSPLFMRFAPAEYNIVSSGYGASILEARADFDNWEKAYFRELCAYGRELGILNSGISPDAFADMLEMLLKGVEVQYTITKDKAATRTTYSEMVDYLIRCNGNNE
jgi:AcrR family transcriptional regulator